MKRNLFKIVLVVCGLGVVFAHSISAQTLGNVWHFPRNAEPSGVPAMRNPAYGITPGSNVTFYNGSYSLDGDQSGGTFNYKLSTATNWVAVPLAFDAQNGQNKYWRAALSTTGFKPGDVVQYYFCITFTDRTTTYVYGTDTTSIRDAILGKAQANPYRFRIAIPWPGGATAGYPSDPASRIHHWKEEAVIGNGYMSVMLDQNGSLYDIYYPSVGNRQGMGTANEGYRGPEEFPACALDQEANGQMNVINGMGGLAIGGNVYWMKNQNGTDFTNVTQRYVTNNNVVYTRSRLAIPGNNIQVEQYDFCPAPSTLRLVTNNSQPYHTNYGVYVKRFLLTNLESTPRTIDFFYDVNFNVNGGTDHDVMSYDETLNRNTMVVTDNTYREVSGGGCGPDGYGTEYKPASYSGNYVKSISVSFGTALKLVTNNVTGAGEPADGSWRDHIITDHQEGWIGKRLILPPGTTTEIDVIVTGSWEDFAGDTNTYSFQGARHIDWFYTNNLAQVQTATENYWTAWLASGVTIEFPGEVYDALWKRSLLASALHVDAATGSIIAGMHNGAYPFVWPRDGVYAAITLARTGHTNESAQFYHWLRDIAARDFDTGIGDKGFFYQKYSTDGYRIWTSPQVDETASVPWGVYYHYLVTGDNAFLNSYWNLVYTSARASSETSSIDGRLNFNSTFNLMDGNNVWEDSFALFIYSNGSVVRGLRDAALIAESVGQGAWASTFRNRANTILGGINGRIDARVEPSDISHLGLVVPYEVYEPTDARMTNMIEWIHGRQSSGGFNDDLVEHGGDSDGLLRRYNHNVHGNIDNYWNGGPWFLATAWYGEYYARWQDYFGGKALVDVNRDKLDRLIAKLGPNGLGAEQISPNSGLQKYPGFSLQTAWPNVWESHSTLLDQMMMFLDYKPLTNGCSFAPKLPTGWTNITFKNMLYRNQRFDIAVSETTNSARANFNKLTSGPLAVDLYLRIPPGVVPGLIARNGSFAVPTAADYNTNTGRVHIQATLSNGASNNVLLVTYGNADTDGDGLPDNWEAQNGLSPLSASGTNGASGDLDNDGFTNAQEFAAGTNPNDPNSLLRITNTANGGRTITWSSVTGKTYRIFSTPNLFTPFAPLSGNVP